MIFEFEKMKEIIQAIKGFNLTKFLLDKKERNLLLQIDIKTELIEHHEQQIIKYGAYVTTTESEIDTLKKEIKQLETDRKKVVKVLNLYIN